MAQSLIWHTTRLGFELHSLVTVNNNCQNLKKYVFVVALKDQLLVFLHYSPDFAPSRGMPNSWRNRMKFHWVASLRSSWLQSFSPYALLPEAHTISFTQLHRPPTGSKAR